MKKRKAFTFIELLVALTIFSIIATSIYYTLNAGIRVWSTTNTKAEDNQMLRVFFEEISRDMRNAVIYSGIKCEGNSSTVSIPTVIDVFDTEKRRMNREIVKVTYLLNSGNVERKWGDLTQGFDTEFAKGEIVLGRLEGLEIEDLSFEYSYEDQLSEEGYRWGGEWLISDDKLHIPRGVKIRVVLKNKDTGSKDVFENVVLIPVGELGKEE